jgi:hypothetical protein
MLKTPGYEKQASFRRTYSEFVASAGRLTFTSRGFSISGYEKVPLS